jgi:hypothetical protein
MAIQTEIPDERHGLKRAEIDIVLNIAVNLLPTSETEIIE